MAQKKVGVKTHEKTCNQSCLNPLYIDNLYSHFQIIDFYKMEYLHYIEY